MDEQKRAGGYMIRPIEPRDDAAMAAIVRRSLETYGLNLPGTAYFDPELDHLSRFYAAKPLERAYFVLEDACGRVLGGAGLAEAPEGTRCAEVQKLYLSEEARGQGLGRRLMERVEQAARSLGYRETYLETHSRLKAAIRLYERLGYRPVDRPPSAVHGAMDCFFRKRLAPEE